VTCAAGVQRVGLAEGVVVSDGVVVGAGASVPEEGLAVDLGVLAVGEGVLAVPDGEGRYCRYWARVPSSTGTRTSWLDEPVWILTFVMAPGTAPVRVRSETLRSSPSRTSPLGGTVTSTVLEVCVERVAVTGDEEVL
jgi:hypothetical protein